MSEIKVGDWVEVVEIYVNDVYKGIEIGDVYKVVCIEFPEDDTPTNVVGGCFAVGRRYGRHGYIGVPIDGDIWRLTQDQVEKVSAPKTKSPKLKDVPKAIESAKNKFETLARSYTENLSETLVAKNADYGNSFGKSYEKHGLVSAVIRLEDKLNRLESLIKKEAQVNESIDDTLLDIAGYAILTLIARGGNHDNSQ